MLVVDGPSCIYQRCWNPKSSISCISMILLLLTCRVGFMSIKVLKSQPAHAPGISYLQEGIPKWIYCSTKAGFPVVYFILIGGMGVSSQIWLNIHDMLKASQHQSGLCIHTCIYIYRKKNTVSTHHCYPICSVHKSSAPAYGVQSQLNPIKSYGNPH